MFPLQETSKNVLSVDILSSKKEVIEMDRIIFRDDDDQLICCHHNSDWSGDAIVIVKNSIERIEYSISGKLLLMIGRRTYKKHLINKIISLLEQM